MNYETVIGLETHAQLLTKSKIFCGCSTTFGEVPNANTCPICTGQPGVLPVLNKKVVELAIKTALALNCKVAPHSIFARKNYFYPDLPKNYQVSQYELPIATGGYLEIEVEGKIKKIGIHRVHLEEDAGKLVHQGATGIAGADYSLVDFNRTGVPLMEIVSEPDIRSPEEAKIFMGALRNLLLYLEVSSANMEEGNLRCDANISLRPVGSKKLGVKTEVKNMNSFKAVATALASEVKRQKELLAEGKKIVHETRHYNDDTGTTVSLRTKEEAHDYRYFPEPDLVPLAIEKEWVAEIKKTIGELPNQKKERYTKKLGLPEHDTTVILRDKEMAKFFEESIKLYNKPKIISKWLIGDITAYLNEKKMSISESKITPENLAETLKAIDNGTINNKMAKDVLVKILGTGAPEVHFIKDLIKESGPQISDESEIKKIVQEIIKNNPQSVADFKAGKEKAIGFLVGQVMKQTKGRAAPALVNKLLKQELSK